MSGGRLSLVVTAAAFGIGVAAGAWLARDDAAPEGARGAVVAADAVPGGRRAAVDADAVRSTDGGPTAAARMKGVERTTEDGTVATPRASAGAAAAMPEPPASWMTVEQQRAAAAAYREWVREEGRLAGERARSLNAELFMIESQDPAWGATMESRVRASMAGSPVFEGAELESIECRVSVCRATVRFIEADTPRGTLRNGGMSPWSEWRNAQIIPLRTEVGDGVPGFRATVFLGEDFDHARLPRGPRAAGPGGP